jgi:hypothetical protein
MTNPSVAVDFRPNVKAGRHLQKPRQNPVIAEVNLFNIANAMREVEAIIQSEEPDRVMSRFQLWSPLFNRDAASESSARYERLISLMLATSEHINWQPTPATLQQSPIIFTALPVSLTTSLMAKLDQQPSFLNYTQWSLHQLPVLARASILDSFTSN